MAKAKAKQKKVKFIVLNRLMERLPLQYDLSFNSYEDARNYARRTFNYDLNEGYGYALRLVRNTIGDKVFRRNRLTDRGSFSIGDMGFHVVRTEA